jgi:hypothetical protein
MYFNIIAASILGYRKKKHNEASTRIRGVMIQNTTMEKVDSILHRKLDYLSFLCPEFIVV